ncbi:MULTISPECIES: DUF427 domain-containing protein [unclassified Cryobacterium]|uniref:DUF427 domain-containing protein n=1 Tax=unclassified Cryobacterium TaxID=2649013 RepID=UPI002AB4CE3B|nr:MULTISPECIES: DUF427 domain-containing protein [unclassified Cryobacterium]MDY7543823.1 DUF427 domain-containing protein [Cryobacterium sp. 5B3]MEA9998502.1 DUF427 domain-containing protein [Cryobacterium sp. RTS3]MEB0267253.1 DUF427 domain-containing protein [Cryobacterium sp. 10I5]MEB0275828.1 DUF427 domain-containing protein [Cryobacterium sp. 5B3]
MTSAHSDRVVPGPGQESVWDYPRPPRIEPVSDEVVIRFGGREIARTVNAVRVLETSHPPAYYLPADAFLPGSLIPAAGRSVCEYKGTASYLTVVSGAARAVGAAWTYPEPEPGFEALAGRIALYPGRMDLCTIDGEEVRPQAGSFYGGWITSRVVGPFKGEPGTLGW